MATRKRKTTTRRASSRKKRAEQRLPAGLGTLFAGLLLVVLARTDHDDEAQTEQIDTSDADAEPTAEQLAAMEAADAASAAETPEADDKSEE